MSQVDEIKDRVDIVDLISSYVPLKKAGQNFKGLCPFHAEKTPSFVVFPQTGTWHCFGACGTGGDIFTFIMKKENLDFGEALRLLADKAGVVLEERGGQDSSERSMLDLLREINASAASYFNHLLLNSPRAEAARQYVAGRGLSDATLEQFGVGYAPAEWDALLRYLAGKGYPVAQIAEAGLIVERDDGTGYYDRFRNRLVIPIRDRRGRAIGFGARALDDSQPKYLNSPQTPLFDKSGVLFGLDKASRGIRARGEAIIVEGYMDVLTAHQHGIDNVVASMGTALTDRQLQALARLSSRFVLALDSDAAGDQATLRGLHAARQALGTRRVPRFDSRGGVRHEARLMADLRIASLPEGMDPDEVIQVGTDQWEALIRGAQPLVEYYLEQVTKDLDPDDPRSKSQAVQEMKPILLELGDEIERQHYLQALARKIRVDEAIVEREILGSRATSGGRRRATRKGASFARGGALVDEAPPTLPSGRDFGIEEQCLAYLVRYPTLIHSLSFAFAEANVPFLEAEDFSRSENEVIYEQIRRNAEQGALRETGAFLEALGKPLAEYLESVLRVDASSPGLPESEIPDDLIHCALRLKAQSLRRHIEQLRYLLQVPAEDDDPEQAALYGRLIHRYTMALHQVDRTLQARSIVGRRSSIEAGIS